MRGDLKGIVEYSLAYGLLKSFGWMPRSLARPAARAFAWCGFHLARRQRRTGLRNLELAFPEMTRSQRLHILKGCFRNIGRLLVEFSHFPELNRETITKYVTVDGFENYAEAVRRGRGVIYLTGHIGAWELGSFSQSIFGYPLKFVVRPIANRRVEQLISAYRTIGGNIPIHRRNAGRDILKALRRNEAVGILFDQNTTTDEGVFAEFFGIPAATTPAIATFALRTGAAVVPAFLFWDQGLGKHRLHFDPPLELVDTGDLGQDIVENTKKFNRVLEHYVRRYPDQWLWIHRRWKTRPHGEKDIYTSS
jgi:Kdo2-lipid IVA lauroyltransferase/acyltransferase